MGWYQVGEIIHIMEVNLGGSRYGPGPSMRENTCRP